MQGIYQENVRKIMKKYNINYKENIRKTQGKHQKFTRKTCEISIKSGICKKNTRNFQTLPVNYQKFPPETGGSVKYWYGLAFYGVLSHTIFLPSFVENRMATKFVVDI